MDSSFGKQIQCGIATLMRQAPDTASLYLTSAIKSIDRQFGEGYAKKNPALVAGFMEVCASDLRTSVILMAAEKIEDRAGEIWSGLEFILDPPAHSP